MSEHGGHKPVAIVLLALWVAAFILYARAPHTQPTVALGSLLVFGLVLPAVVLILTRSSVMGAMTGRNPGRIALTSLAYVAFFSLCVLGPLFDYVSHAIPDGRNRSLVLLAIKVITMMALPLAIMKWQQLKLQPPRPMPSRPAALFALPGVALLTVILLTPCLSQIASLHLSGGTFALAMGGSLLWVTANAAMPEELLFRVYLQSALSVRIGSGAHVIAATVLVFAAAHIPGLYLRADQAGALGTVTPTVWLCAAYAIAVLAPIGFFFSVLWARTGSLLMLILVHAAIDWLPNVVDFSHQWLR